jgi:hypothetical protein
MALEVTPVNRNLHTRVTFLGLEFEDLFAVMGLAALMNVVGRFIGGEVGGIPIGVILQYGVPLFCIPILMLFKYGKPRGYFQDLLNWQFQPRKYCALAHDKKIRTDYLKGEEECR